MRNDFRKLDKAERAMPPTDRRKTITEKLPRKCGFTVVVDTREQAPWHFTGIDGDDGEPLIVPLVTDIALATGDYSILGLQDQIAIERKSAGDFRGSITADRERFEREMERMAAMRYAAVVIEASLEELLSPPAVSQVNPTTIARTIQSWSIRYGVHFFPIRSRRVAEVWAFRLLQMFWRHGQHEQQDQKEETEQVGKTSLNLNI